MLISENIKVLTGVLALSTAKQYAGLTFFFNCLQGDMVREKCNDCESGTLNRFYDRQVKRRVARQEHVAGNHKRLVN